MRYINPRLTLTLTISQFELLFCMFEFEPSVPLVCACIAPSHCVQ